MFENLNKYNILLASKSPRRRELMSGLLIPYKCISIDNVVEEYPKGLQPVKVPEFLANLKADAYQYKLKENDLVITADTVVIIDGYVLGKPDNDHEAVDMLMRLSGKTHHVVTGVCLSTTTHRKSFTDTTAVTFNTITKNEAEYYVSKFSPLDKAGAYGVQEWIGYVAVKHLDGSFYNVMGLPTHRLFQELLKF